MSKRDNFITSGKWKMILLELIINTPHPNQYMHEVEIEYWNKQYDVKVHYHINDFLTIATILRLYHIIRASAIYS